MTEYNSYETHDIYPNLGVPQGDQSITVSAKQNQWN